MRVEAALQARHTRIVTIRMDETVLAAARRLRAENIGVLVVKDTCATEGDAVAGIVTERDILQVIADHGTAAFSRPVHALLKKGAVFCRPEDSIECVLSLMDERHIRYIPVLDEEALVGVISMRDAMTLSKGRAVAHRPALAPA
ncbi:MAG TPA: CBS domain-containing protein [Crenalkalicoccus sp.]|jgi:CBS domain-containing protein|nr:CBS domain-containing protein [Crenalkalicoccus sp.]